MSVSRDDVKKVARLSRIAVAEDQLDTLTDEFARILEWIEQLNEVNVEGIEPMTSPAGPNLAMRDDTVTDGGIRDSVLANAPKADEGFFVVPKSVE
ncbi:MAG: Asp-tRNA(Asn)/Glu-tRNA(Gln) amidotransferase subunit GatC [Pseudomonadota bacterium]